MFLSLCSLKLLISEEICGRFGSVDGSASTYRALRVLPDDRVSASLSCRVSVSFETEAHTDRRLHSFSDGCDVQRFDVKDKRVSAFQLESLILAQNERWRQA